MDRFLHTPIRLLMIFGLTAFFASTTLAHDGSYDDNGFCTDEECTEKYQPAELNKIDDWYEISNAGQLYWFAEQVDKGNPDLINAKVRLTRDIIDNDVTFSYDEESDYAPIATDAIGKNVDINTLRVWNPIGIQEGIKDDKGGGKLADENYPDKQKWFGGHFDGQSHSISGLYFNDDTVWGGLFAFLRFSCNIDNVKLKNCYFKGYIVGSIAAHIEGGFVNNCHNSSFLYGNIRAGGIVAQALSRFSGETLYRELNICNCVNEGTVYSKEDAGGIVGYGWGTYKGASFSCLLNLGKVISDYVSGEIMSEADYGYYTFKSCFSVNSNKPLVENGKVVTINSQIFPMEYFHNGKVAYQLSLTDENWGQDLSQSESIPSYGGAKVFKLCGENYTNDINAIAEHSWEDGVCTKCDDKQEAIFNTEKNSYEISNLGQLLWFDEWFWEYGLKWDENTNAHLTTDITINKETLDYDGKQNKVLVNGETDKESSLKTWKTLGKTHTIEGNGHTISGFYGETFGDGSIQNLTIKNAVVIDYGAFGGKGSVTNCHFKGVVKTSGAGGGFTYATSSSSIISNCSFEGRFYGSDDKIDNAGGFVGCNSGTIKDCSFIGECFNLQGEIARIRFAGGNSNKIENCYSSILASNQESELEKKAFLVATYNHGTIQNIAYDKDKLTLNDVQSSSAYSTIENVIGYTTEQIKSGEVTYWLNGNKSDGTQAWYQKLGENGDAYPVLTATGDNIVYHGTKCDKETDVYTNDNSIFGEDGTIPHNYEITNVVDGNGLYGGVCTECNASNESIKYIHDFCGEKGRDIKLTVASDGSYSTEESIQLSDKAEYNSPVDFEVADFTYTRNNPHTEWQVYYVPFDIECSELANAGITAAYINNFHEYTKNGETEVVLEVKEVTSGTLKANVPYVIKAATSGETQIHTNNVMLHKAEAKALSCQSVTHDYSFKGIYKAQSGFNQDENINNGIIDYTLKGGKFLELTKTATLSPMRWYLTICDRNKATETSSAQSARVSNIQIKVVGEGEATGIEGIHVITDGNVSVNQGIYDLQGRRLCAEPTHGVYIKNGKKIIK